MFAKICKWTGLVKFRENVCYYMVHRYFKGVAVQRSFLGVSSMVGNSLILVFNKKTGLIVQKVVVVVSHSIKFEVIIRRGLSKLSDKGYWYLSIWINFLLWYEWSKGHERV